MIISVYGSRKTAHARSSNPSAPRSPIRTTDLPRDLSRRGSVVLGGNCAALQSAERSSKAPLSVPHREIHRGIAEIACARRRLNTRARRWDNALFYGALSRAWTSMRNASLVFSWRAVSSSLCWPIDGGRVCSFINTSNDRKRKCADSAEFQQSNSKHNKSLETE